MRLNPKENPGLPFELPKPTRTREEIERSVLEKLDKKGTKLDFNREEAEVYAEMLERARRENQEDKDGGFYGQAH